MSADTIEVQGADVAEAIRKACKALNAAQEELNIEVVATGTAGIFGLGKRKARLRVSKKSATGERRAETKAATPPAGKPEEPSPPIEAAKPKKQRPRKQKAAEKKAAPPATEIPAAKKAGRRRDPVERPEITPEIINQFNEILAGIITRMGFTVDIATTVEEGSLVGRIDGPDAGEIIGPEGKTLDSLQYLVRKIVGKAISDKISLSLDAGDYRAARLKELEERSRAFAAEVKTSGKTRSIPALNPSERRAIHLALQDDQEIRSRSVGEGIYKKVLIYKPGKGRKGPPRKKKPAAAS